MRKILIIFVLFIVGCNQQATGDKSPQIGDILGAFVGSGANCIHSHQQTGRGRLDNMMHNAAEQAHWNRMEYLHEQQNWQNSDLKQMLDQQIYMKSHPELYETRPWIIEPFEPFKP